MVHGVHNQQGPLIKKKYYEKSISTQNLEKPARKNGGGFAAVFGAIF